MALRLSIENETSLPDGGPLSVTLSGKRGLDIGRDQYLDWTLPDPSRYISGKHCEIRYHDGGYWLHDVSTNGTFLNGSDHRIQGPHRLRHGDRIEIGHYIIAVALDEEDAAAPVRDVPPPSDQRDLWSDAGDAAPPLRPKDVLPPPQPPVARGDFLDWVVDAPGAPMRNSREPPPGLPDDPDDMSWARGPAPKPPPVEAPPPTPMPRRPARAPSDPGGGPPSHPWAAPSCPSPGMDREGQGGLEPGPDRGAAALPAARHEAPPARDAPSPSGPVPSAAPADFRRRLAKGAGVPEEVFASHDPGELAEELGVLIRLVAEDLKQLLGARTASKRAVRSASQTVIQALDNNPLKFAPTAEDALRIMFGPPTSGYLDARRTFEQSFRDLKSHQIKTYAAMQHAVRMLVEDLDPKAIEESTEPDRGLAAVIGSRKAKLWDVYVARWQAKTSPHEDGLVEAFMLYFSDFYDRSRDTTS